MSTDNERHDADPHADTHTTGAQGASEPDNQRADLGDTSRADAPDKQSPDVAGGVLAESPRERGGRDKDELRTDLEEAEWTQAETPGSDVVLERLADPASEVTTGIGDPGTEATTDLSAAAARGGEDLPTSAYSPRRLYRDPYAGPTTEEQEEADAEAERQAEAARSRQAAEAARLEAERVASERAARNRALGVVAPSGGDVQAPPPPQKLVTDRFLGAAGLFLFRLVIAAVIGVRGYQMVTNIPAVQDALAAAALPEPAIMAWVSSISMLAIAVALFLGLLVRVSGFGLAVLAGLSLAFLRWGAFSPFLNEGFRGEVEVLLVGAGLVFLCLGGGRWGIDGSFRSARAKAKAAAQD